MSFAVARMVKMKSHDLKGIQFHNQRERESKTNPDIDKSKTDWNYDLHNSTQIDYNKRVKEIIDSQKISERKTRKDAVLVNELLITSDQEFFEKLSPAEEKRFFEESYKLFSERYGNQNIAYAMVHMDEKTPHLHLGVVPMRDGKLQGKNVFNRQELQWIQEEFPKHLQKLGFEVERGEKGSKREHIETQKFKADTLDQQVKTLESKIDDVQKAYEVIKKVDEFEVKEKKDLKARIGLNGSHMVEMTFEDFESIKTLAKTSEGLRRENKRLKNKNKVLETDYSNLEKRYSSLSKDFKEVKAENEKLEKIVKSSKHAIEYLSKTLEVVKMSAHRHLGILREKMQEYVGESRLHALNHKFGRVMFSKENLDIHIPSDERIGAEKYIAKINKQKQKAEQEQDKPTKNQSKDDFELDM
jgi:hypothetical protein